MTADRSLRSKVNGYRSNVSRAPREAVVSLKRRIYTRKVTKLFVNGSCWKATPQRVIVPYMKTNNLSCFILEYLKTRIAWGNPPELTGKAKYFLRPIVN